MFKFGFLFPLDVEQDINCRLFCSLLRNGALQLPMAVTYQAGYKFLILIMKVYNVTRPRGAESAVECELPKHCGPVKSMDFNPSKKCLLASGSSASEIHIVDINKPETLMTPGAKAQVINKK